MTCIGLTRISFISKYDHNYTDSPIFTLTCKSLGCIHHQRKLVAYPTSANFMLDFRYNNIFNLEPHGIINLIDLYHFIISWGWRIVEKIFIRRIYFRR